MIKIMQVVPALNDGGAETLIKDYALNLDKKKFEVVVVTIYNYEYTANYKILKENNVRIVSVYEKWNFKNKIINKLFKKQYITQKFGEIIKQENPQCIHIHMDILKYFTPLKKQLTGRKLFYTCHNIPARYFDGTRIDEFESAKTLINRNNLQLIALHKTMAKELNEMFDVSNTIILNNCINLERFKNVIESKEDIRRKLGIPSNAFVIGNVGRFAKEKNHEFIVRVFNEVTKKCDNAFLMLIGQGTEKEKIREELNQYGILNKTIFFEHRNDVPQLMKAMDVLLFPSKVEGFPITLIEAQAVGIKCVISTCITEEVVLTNNVVRLNLQDSIQLWVEAVLDNSIIITNDSRIDSFDKKHVIFQLERLYLGEKHE